MTYTKELVMSIVEKMLGPRPTGIYVPYDEYQYGESDDPSMSRIEDYEDDWKICDTKDFIVRRGATKVVITPLKEDFVIKLSITGTYFSESECHYYSCEYPCFPQKATENVLFKEEKIYNIAPPLLKKIIKPNLYIGSYNGIPIFIQEKVAYTWEYIKNKYDRKFNRTDVLRQETVKTIQGMSHREGESALLDDSFVNLICDWLGEEKTMSLLLELKKSNIYDLNDGNYGLDSKGRPCLFDIAGFDEDEFFDTNWQSQDYI